MPTNFVFQFSPFKVPIMIQLLFQTLQMMLLTFAIGFVVAFVVKSIALVADRFEFHRTHHAEYLMQKELRKERVRKLYETLFSNAAEADNDLYIGQYHGVSKGDTGVDITEDFLHGVSKGSDHYNIIDYYYPKKEKK